MHIYKEVDSGAHKQQRWRESEPYLIAFLLTQLSSINVWSVFMSVFFIYIHTDLDQMSEDINDGVWSLNG